ncbi:MAG TPA: hypothetical protein VL092_03340 [Chitinophagaceae bacterium]|nr:hypothetical protein [Chitinophagaceae bacterium]
MRISSLFYLLCLAQILLGQALFARPVILGQHSSSSANYSGMNGKYKYASAEFVVRASEINDSGMISSISFFKCSGDSAITGIDSVHIYLKESDTGISKTASMSGYTEVFSGVVPTILSKGWIGLTLSSPFLYSGTKNISILIVRKNGSKIVSGFPNFAVSFSDKKEYQAAYFLSDNDPWTGTPATSSQNQYAQYRPYLQLTID